MKLINVILGSLIACHVSTGVIDPTHDNCVCSLESVMGPIGYPNDFSKADDNEWMINPDKGTFRSKDGRYLTLKPKAPYDENLDMIPLADSSDIPDKMRFDIIAAEDDQFIIRSRADPSLVLDAGELEDGKLRMAPFNGQSHQLFRLDNLRTLNEYRLRRELWIEEKSKFANEHSFIWANLQSMWGPVGETEDHFGLVRGSWTKGCNWAFISAIGAICAGSSTIFCMIVVPDQEANVQLFRRTLCHPPPIEATFNIIPVPGCIHIQSRAFPDLFLDADETEAGQFSMRPASESPSQVFYREYPCVAHY